jgi:hypothetical protein
LARNLVTPCLGREPKARVTTNDVDFSFKDIITWIKKLEKVYKNGIKLAKMPFFALGS